MVIDLVLVLVLVNVAGVSSILDVGVSVVLYVSLSCLCNSLLILQFIIITRGKSSDDVTVFLMTLMWVGRSILFPVLSSS